MPVNIWILSSIHNNKLRKCRECSYLFKNGDIIISRKGGDGNNSRTYYYCTTHALQFLIIEKKDLERVK